MIDNIMKKIYSRDLYFSYIQFYIQDKVCGNDTAETTEAHFNQGFARLPHSIKVGTLREFGVALLEVYLGTYEPLRDYDRVIAVPLHIESGEILFEDPDNAGLIKDFLSILPGHYRVVIAQQDLFPELDETEVEDHIEAVDVFFELLEEPLAHSSILVCDERLNPPDVLLETADLIVLEEWDSQSD
jgi:hypothetical protein